MLPRCFCFVWFLDLSLLEVRCSLGAGEVHKCLFNLNPKTRRFETENMKMGEQAHSVGESSTSSLVQAFLLFTQLAWGTSFFLWLLGGAGVRLAFGVDPLALGRGLLERFPAVFDSVVGQYVQ
jgi:hypothetical protein